MSETGHRVRSLPFSPRKRDALLLDPLVRMAADERRLVPGETWLVGSTAPASDA
jgi:hypothetical protein